MTLWIVASLSLLLTFQEALTANEAVSDEAPFELKKDINELSVLSIERDGSGSYVKVRRLSFWLREVDQKKESFELEYILLGSPRKRKKKEHKESILTFSEVKTFSIEVSEVAQDKIVGTVRIKEKTTSQLRVSTGRTGHWFDFRRSIRSPSPFHTVVLGVPSREDTGEYDPTIQVPKMLSRPLPNLTQAGRAAKVNGLIVLRSFVGKDGLLDPFSFRVLIGLGHGYEEEAFETVANRWRFKPATKNGEPVDCWITLEFTFGIT